MPCRGTAANAGRGWLGRRYSPIPGGNTCGIATGRRHPADGPRPSSTVRDSSRTVSAAGGQARRDAGPRRPLSNQPSQVSRTKIR